MSLATISPVAGELLGAEGFEEASPCWWTREAGEFREHFRIQLMRGATYTINWGLDLKISPDFRSGKFAPKSRKTPARDLIFDPIDVSGDVEGWHSFNESSSCKSVHATVNRCLSPAADDFARVRSIADFVSEFEKRSEMRFQRFGLNNYILTDLAWGVALTAIGRREESRLHLNRFCERFNADPNSRVLERALIAAQSLSGAAI